MSRMAVKTLSEVEVNSLVSNQHEFNGVSQLRQIFGAGKQCFSAEFTYLSNNGIERRSRGSLTWYDARENIPYRSAEYRLYYDLDLPLRARAGDTLLITVDDYNQVNVFIIARGTQIVRFLENQIKKKIGTTYSILTDNHIIEIIENFLSEM